MGGWEALVGAGRGQVPCRGLTCTPVPAGVAEQVRLPVPTEPGNRAAADAGGAVQGRRRHAALWGPGGHRSAGSVLRGQLEMCSPSPTSESLVARSGLPVGCGGGRACCPWGRTTDSRQREPLVVTLGSPRCGHGRGNCVPACQAPSPLDSRGSNCTHGARRPPRARPGPALRSASLCCPNPQLSRKPEIRALCEHPTFQMLARNVNFVKTVFRAG